LWAEVPKVYTAAMDRDALLAATEQLLLGLGDELVAAYVFGSVARGTAGPRSDLDLGVLCRNAPEPDLGGLRFDLAEKLELAVRRPVDIVVLNSAPADLVHRVLRDGILVHDANRRARLDFEVRARAQYLDLAPLRELYRRPVGAPLDATKETA
jgi:predicted nucleotidyltransferase